MSYMTNYMTMDEAVAEVKRATGNRRTTNKVIVAQIRSWVATGLIGVETTDDNPEMFSIGAVFKMKVLRVLTQMFKDADTDMLKGYLFHVDDLCIRPTATEFTIPAVRKDGKDPMGATVRIALE